MKNNKKKEAFYMIDKAKHDLLLKKKLLTPAHRWLYCVLCKKNNDLTNGSRKEFFRSISDLQIDSGLSRQTIVNGLKYLKEIKVIRTWQEPKRNNGKTHKETITHIQVL